MFINEKILKRLMLKAYKGNGLYMSRSEGWYTLQGGYWNARIAVGCMPKELLAAMVECAGVIPMEGESWTADKEKNQLDLGIDFWQEIESDGTELSITPVAIVSEGGTLYRVLQFPGGTVMTFRSDLVSAADPSRIDRDNDEGSLEGPYYDGGGGVYWETNHAMWRVMECRITDCETLTSRLGEIPLRRDEAYEKR